MKKFVKFIALHTLWSGQLPFLGLMLLSSTVYAHDPEPTLFNLVNFQTQASREVPNDTIIAILNVEMDDIDPGKLANNVNQIMRQALKVTTDFKSVKVKTGNYQTYPVYSKNKLTHWHIRQEMRLEGNQFDDVTNLIGKLQGQLQLARLTFSVSPEAQRKIEDNLITEAIASFKHRAELISNNLNAKSYKIKDMNVQTSEGAPRPEFAMRSLAISDSNGMAPPALESGTSRITVIAAGAIKLD